MSAKKKAKKKHSLSQGVLARNRKALYEYTVIERIEAGLALLGTEVKVVRNGEASLVGAYVAVENGEALVHQIHIPPYEFGNRFNHTTLRTRRLLLHRREIMKLKQHVEQKGNALIPLKLYLKNGRVKLELGVCRGKAQYDKRETIKRRTSDRDTARAVAMHFRG